MSWLARTQRDEAIYLVIGTAMLCIYLGACVAVLTWPIGGP